MAAAANDNTTSGLAVPSYDSCVEFMRIAQENKHNITNAITPNTGTEHWFIEFCKTAKPDQIVHLLAGFTDDLPATTLAAETVNKILPYHDSVSKDAYKYVHALCPYVHDRWNLNKDKCIGGSFGGLVDCYWRNMGDLTYKPQLNEFAKLVLSSLTSGFTFSITQSKMSNDSGLKCCVVDCYDDAIRYTGSYYNGYICTNCRSAYHTSCFNKINNETLDAKMDFNGQRINMCPVCHITWDLKNAEAHDKGYQKW